MVTMKIKGQALFLVADKYTIFSAAAFLKQETSECAWETLLSHSVA